ncbi:hypothetical protein BHE74_00058483, partial [Ensete ventricosum]
MQVPLSIMRYWLSNKSFSLISILSNMAFYFLTRFAILTCTAQYGRYIPVRQVTGMRTARYRAVPSKIDHRRSISVIGGRLKKKSTVGGRLREKSIVGSQLRKKKERRRGKEKKNEEGKKEYLARLHVVVASGLPVAAVAFSPARGDGASPHAGRKIEATSPPFLFFN